MTKGILLCWAKRSIRPRAPPKPKVYAVILSTDIWVAALIRRANLEGAFAVVARRGDARAGAVLVKVRSLKSGAVKLYAEATRSDGERVWMQPRPDASEADLEAYGERALRIDPDLWIVDIEDPEGRHFLTERVE